MLEQVPKGYIVFRSAPISLADSQPGPDVMVVRGGSEDLQGQHPSTAGLIVEVTAVHIAVKRELAAMYAEAGVPKHWIVRADKKEGEGAT